MLLEAGADTNVTFQDGHNLFITLVKGGDCHIDTIKYLVEKGGADPNQMAVPNPHLHKDHDDEHSDCHGCSAASWTVKMTPLHLTVTLGVNLVFDYLSRLPQVDIGKKDEKGRTAKELAQQVGNNRAFKRLREEERKRKKMK